LYNHSTLGKKEINELFESHDNKNLFMKAGVGIAAKELIEEGITQGKMEKL